MDNNAIYQGGMYVRDGVYSAGTHDQRPGVAAIVYRLKQMQG